MSCLSKKNTLDNNGVTDISDQDDRQNAIRDKDRAFGVFFKTIGYMIKKQSQNLEIFLKEKPKEFILTPTTFHFT